ncbi:MULTISPECIES: MerR family transcriptional regulator [unclassified Sphingomonas]|uniref:MerR family transcriptional regulator n=1 Tax=unclassified Sphingomonas TaxID=196159 RepID=UPI001D122FEE|nr:MULTISPECIES: MerR family DNA-binding protein [unclassified Sphingomonas]MCC2981274.1 MerR family DNA-binding protein [Sphingomonas sp. IC4-52]MCD2316985.1 MerR family DNA-binding protein [Sphingomonas sp. IC-11]
MTALTIAGLAQAGGVGVETVRYYHRRGLLAQPDRPARGVRRYDVDDVRRLQFIRAAQSAGFSLEQIGELLELDSSHDRERARALARARIEELEQRISSLQAARDWLSDLERDCADNATGPCPILKAFNERAA